MANRIASLSTQQIRAAVRAACYSRKEDADYITEVLIQRRNIIARSYGANPTD